MAEATTPCPKCGGPRFVYQAKTRAYKRCRRCLAEKARERYRANRAVEVARGRAWRQANPEKVRQCNRAWREKNPGRMDELNRAYYAANRDTEIARAVAYTKAHPAVAAAIKHRREARKRGAVCEHGPLCVDAAFMAAVRSGQCLYCTSPAQQADHFYPLSKGGLHCRDNIVSACRSCNARKRNKDPEAWIASLR